jgi:hypothetical protein
MRKRSGTPLSCLWLCEIPRVPRHQGSNLAETHGTVLNPGMGGINEARRTVAIPAQLAPADPPGPAQ